MSKRTDPSMSLDIGPYLADTARLTTEGHGAFLLLLVDYWRNGPPPDDDETLAAITRLTPERWVSLRPALHGLFVIRDGRWRHARVELAMWRAAVAGLRARAAQRARGATGAP